MRGKFDTDIAVIGGGASGLAAAIGAAETYNCRITVAERLDRVGKKLLATGNGRCNLSNRFLAPERYSGSVKNMMDIIGTCSDTEEFFMTMGLLCTADSEGRLYPKGNSAASVLDALRLKLEMLGCSELCGFDVREIVPNGSGFTLVSENRSLRCRKLIIAAGGYAAPMFGTDGSIMRILRDMGFKTTKLCPAAAPLRVSADELKGLKGVRVKCRVSAFSDDDLLHEENGEVQFTENSLSGICVFNMARYFADHEGRLSIELDLCPDMSRKSLEEFICLAQSMRFGCSLQDLLTGLLTKKLAVYIVKRALARPVTESASDLRFDEIQAIAALIKKLRFKVTGASSWQNAQATSGGIHGSCVDKRLRLKELHGCYICGEILDVVGDCGGFNLQWAWASGTLAGRSCAEELRAEDNR